jgi:hypothetical protein
LSPVEAKSSLFVATSFKREKDLDKNAKYSSDKVLFMWKSYIKKLSLKIGAIFFTILLNLINSVKNPIKLVKIIYPS